MQDLKRLFLIIGVKGFTLVELAIVMTVASGIMVIVFFAISSANQGRRDTERKAAVGRLAAAVEATASNSSTGTYPANCAGIGGYTANGYACDDSTIGQSTIKYTRGSTCSGSGTAKNFKLEVTVESGGGGTFCKDNK